MNIKNTNLLLVVSIIWRFLVQPTKQQKGTSKSQKR